MRFLSAIDFNTLLYGVASSAVFALLMRWMGLGRWLSHKIRRRHGLRRYRRVTREAISTATVVGRRQGFDISQVYVDLDLAPSDLMTQQDKEPHARPRVFVLVGGPGAGKSTYVKREALKLFDTGRAPFFLRLRDYSGDEPLEAYFAARLSQAGVPRAEQEFEFSTRVRGELVILDGLDEVRVPNRGAVCDRINSFYKRFFTQGPGTGRLIVTCRKEAYRGIPLDLPIVWEVRPLTDEQIQRFARLWPLGYPSGKSAEAFSADLFATPKILQLARSPLLLVGGLMQYTESNLGIPEERFQYLERIARWLLSDWAAAQGLPPDALRPLYERVIPRLAFEMHRRTTAELPVDEALKCLKEWLPQFGTAGSDASKVLEGIFTRTGILVRDVPGAIVFAQFSLQEYFVATVWARDLRLLEGVISAGVSTWGREAVLLAVAQLEDPSTVLDELFRRESTLGAEGVAECPTPSIAMQFKAVEACTVAIDTGHEAAHRATVALLRKVSASPEAELLRQLDTRLIRGDNTASTVGLILAHAGTAGATDLLALRPDIWEECLKSAGYLSSSFERLLISVIASGIDVNSVRAMQLLVPRVSSDRRKELLSMLPTLAPERAAVLAGLLLRTLEPVDRYTSIDEIELNAIALCAVHLRKIENLPPSNVQRPLWYGASIVEVAAVIACSGHSRSAARLSVILDRGARWAHDMRSGLFVVGSAILTGSMLVAWHLWYLQAMVGAAIVVFAGITWSHRRSTYILNSLYIWSPWSLQAVLAGIAISIAFAGFDFAVIPVDDPAARAAAGAILAFPLITAPIYYLRPGRIGAVDRLGRRAYGWCSLAWIVLAIVVALVAARYPSHAIRLAPLVVAVLVTQLSLLAASARDARIFSRASDEALEAS